MSSILGGSFSIKLYYSSKKKKRRLRAGWKRFAIYVQYDIGDGL
jgi:hypothetical protein